MNVQKKKEEFLNCAIEHEKAYSQGNFTVANKFHRRLQRLYTSVNSEGYNDFFLEFIDSENESIRLWSATFSLKCYSRAAENCLEELSQSSSIIGLGAKMTLKLWKEGKLELL